MLNLSVAKRTATLSQHHFLYCVERGVYYGRQMSGSTRPHLSVVVPVYGCGDCLRELARQIDLHVSTFAPSYELLLVCDQSPDDSWQVIRELGAKDARVRGIALSRNFGQHTAILAGTDFAEGDYLVVMDCDLQHAPADIPAMYARVKEGFDVVFARRTNRKDGAFKQLTSRLFVGLRAYLTDTRGDPDISNFSIVSRKVVLELRRIRERNRSYPYFVAWLGFDTAYVEAEHHERFAGQTSYSFSKLIRHAVESIVSASDKPLRLSIQLGVGLSFISLVWAAYLVVRFFGWATPVEGWTSVMVSLFFIAGLLFANLGVIGLYVGRIFDETKGRPLYAIKDTVNVTSATGER